MRELDYALKDALEGKLERGVSLTPWEAARLTVYRIYRNLSGRMGMDAPLNNIDSETMSDIVANLTAIVLDTMGPLCEGKEKTGG